MVLLRFWLFALLALFAVPTLAQERVQQGATALRLDAVDISKADEGQFVFYASFLDEFFKAISATEPSGWTVFFQGKAQAGEVQVSELKTAQGAGVSVVFVFARDEQSDRDGVFKAAKEGTQRILSKLRPNLDRSAAVVYSNSLLDSGRLAVDHNQTATWFEDVKPEGNIPALYDGIEKALAFFPSTFKDIGPNRVIVIIGDGVDRDSEKSRVIRERIDKTVSEAQRLNVRVNVVGLKSLADEALEALKGLANTTGGTYREAADIPQLDLYLNNTEDELLRQHVIFFKTLDFEPKLTGLKVAVKFGGNDYATNDRVLKLPEPKSQIWFWVIVGGISVGGLLFLFLIIKLIGKLLGGRRPREERARGPDMGKCRQCGNVRPVEWKVCQYCEALPHLGRLKIVSGGDLNGVVFFIKDSLTNIGSADGNQFIVPDSSVSKRHAGIKVQDNRFELADYGSTNGVLVNGQRITKQFLKDGDSVRIGMVELEFKLKG
jgi:hypothetical protein